MTDKKSKIWFIGYSSRFWVPISIEGWLLSAGLLIGIPGIVKIVGVNLNESVSLGPLTLVFVLGLALIMAFYQLSDGHVDKRY